jgi:hypothetical protein
LIAASVILLIIAEGLSRRGLVNGYVTLFMGFFARDIVRFFDEAAKMASSTVAIFMASNVAKTILIFIAVGAITTLLLRGRIRSGTSVVELPTCGIIPLNLAAAVVVALGLLRLSKGGVPFEILGGDLEARPSDLYATLGLAIFWSFVFSRPMRFQGQVQLLSPKPQPLYTQGSFCIAMALSTVGVMVLAGISQHVKYLLPFVPSVVVLATVVGMLMDLIADTRAFHRNPTLVPVWTLQNVQLTDFAVRGLHQHGIDVHVQGLYFRKLYHFFAPFVPLKLFVPADRAADAEEILRNFLPETTRELADQASPAQV